jgi:hypothetical protein
MILVRVALEKNTRNAADSAKRRHCGPHRGAFLASIVRNYAFDAAATAETVIRGHPVLHSPNYTGSTDTRGAPPGDGTG